jgi:hypothetical protein
MFARGPFLFVSLACCATGCLNPQTTRLPSLTSGDPRIADPQERDRAERRDLERHDPFPSNSAGPQTFTRPRGHVEERTDIRRIREEAMLRGMNRNGVDSQPSSKLDPYPDTVRE